MTVSKDMTGVGIQELDAFGGDGDEVVVVSSGVEVYTIS